MLSKSKTHSETQEKPQKLSRRKQYQVIPLKTRQRLVEAVMEEGATVIDAAKHLNINYSTAKAIVRKYQTKGNYFRRKSEIISSEEVEDQINSSPARQRTIRSTQMAVANVQNNVPIISELANQAPQPQPQLPIFQVSYILPTTYYPLPQYQFPFYPYLQ